MKLLAGTLVLLSAYGQTPSSKGVNFYSIEREISFGKTVTAALEREVSVTHDSTVDAYLESLGRTLRPPDAIFGYRFVTYKGASLGSGDEAVAIPGGTIFISFQSIADAPTDASIATKIAHAIAHLELRQDIKLIFIGRSRVLLGTNAFEADADKAATTYLTGRQENTAGFEAARNAARATLERN